MITGIKICGITSVADANYAVSCGASAIGIIFYKPSKRYVTYDDAKKIIKSINCSIPVVGVFVNEKIEIVKDIVNSLKLDIVQLHGSETAEYCMNLALPVIKAFRVRQNFDNAILLNYGVSAYLFDTYKAGLMGGTGDIFNWNHISSLNSKIPIILSGGLNVGNVLEAINIVKPTAIDVNSGVEIVPGIKDHNKVSELFDKIDLDGNENVFERIRLNVQ